MKLITPFLASLGLTLAAAAASAPTLTPAEVAKKLEQIPATHPRLFLSSAGEAALKQQIAADPLWAKLAAGVTREADQQLRTKPVERVLIGRRLLDKSRTALSRILHLGLAWRLTGDKKYLDRARAELLAVSAFTDWNPKHFLDVAEMTTAVGIGYDWFYSALDDAARRTLHDAILKHGLITSRTANSWTKVVNNWNQVCNGGMTIGALAVAETDRALAAEMIARAVNTVPLAMHEFAPDGAYPEGPGYWGYGTTYNVLLIHALQSALGTDFGLSQQPGFLATADYYLHVIGPSGYYFNYSDCGRGGTGLSPAMFWFAAQRQQPELLWNEWPKLAAGDERRSGRGGRDRTDPMLLLWMSRTQGKPTTPPAALSWTGQGPTPVAFHRSSWDRNASFVALKGGTPSANHAHMDVGAFVMDADGVRWADDLGSQDYNSLESAGINLWGKTQDGDRWKVFRLGTSSHNVLMIDGQQQRVDGVAPIVLSKTGRTIVDLARIYRGQVTDARRGAALQPDRTVIVQDELTAGGKSMGVRWAMVTQADVKIDGHGRATLSQAGKKLEFRVLEPAGAPLEIYPTDPPPGATDARNPGTRMLGFEVAVAAGMSQRIVVQLVPASAKPAPVSVQPLSAW
ncbi:MAG: heparinase II/III family protein [Verrucomicrobia bacterium]|nr:heparinase II/III family protein [Verrucomicrobiota bacterium]